MNGKNKQDEDFQNQKKILPWLVMDKKQLFFKRKKISLTQYPYKEVHEHTSEL